jgi:futalosine hydrolase
MPNDLNGQPLLLIPTEMERRRFAETAGSAIGGLNARLCGFGPIVAAARTAELVQRRTPPWVLLVGIAGTYDNGALPIGSAACFQTTELHGIGAGSGGDFLSPTEMGLAQWPGGQGTDCGPIEQRLELASVPRVPTAGMLLTVCAASGSIEEARQRQDRYPSAAAEDMESFGVGVGCALAGVPLVVVRGISNLAGCRDVAAWKIREALAAAAELASSVVTQAIQTPMENDREESS